MPFLSRVIALTDNLRLAESASLHPERYKEWHHFCVLSAQAEVVLNFSIMRDNRPAAPANTYLARLILLVHEAGWDGDVIEIPWREVELNPGRIDLRFGQNYLRFEHGVYKISIALETRPITLDLTIRPITYPLLRSRAGIGSGAIDWLVVPRLEAEGVLVCDRRVHLLKSAPAYHDHNWGHWLWGEDFAWEWGFALPVLSGTPISLVFDRVTNRARSQVQELKLSLWKNDRLVRIFAHHEISSLPKGYLAQAQVAKFPRIMSLIVPQVTTDVPRSLEITAESGSDYMSFCFESEDLAQLILPNETDLGETVINEVVGTVHASGLLKGEKVVFEGKGFFEFLT
jgi:hypothetical protein